MTVKGIALPGEIIYALLGYKTITLHGQKT